MSILVFHWPFNLSACQAQTAYMLWAVELSYPVAAARSGGMHLEWSHCLCGMLRRGVALEHSRRFTHAYVMS